MQSTKRMKLVTGVFVVAVSVGFAPAVIGCDRLSNLLDENLPPALDDPAQLQALLTPTAASRVIESFDLETLRQLVDDDLPYTTYDKNGVAVFGSVPPVAGDDCAPLPDPIPTEPFDSGSALKLNRNRQMLRYLNRTRLVAASMSPAPLPNAAACAQLATGVITALAVPNGELGSVDVSTVGQATGEVGNGASSTAQVLRLVTVLRQEASIPVLGSALRIAIDASSELASLQLQWPQLRMQEGLDERLPRDRQAIVDDLSERILAATDCESVASISATLAYMPQTGSVGDDDDTGDQQDVIKYAPMLAAVVTTATNSGIDDEGQEFEESSPVMTYLVELFEPAADE